MRFDFFRRSASRGTAAEDETVKALAPNPAEPEVQTRPPKAEGAGEPGGYVTYTMLLDPQQRVKGYRMAWSAGEPAEANTHFHALVSCVSKYLNPPKGWRLGGLLLFFDVTVESLFLSELQSLPPENVVLCMRLADFMDEDTRSMLLFLREQGFGFMLLEAESLPEDPEISAIISHVDVGAGKADLIASIRRQQKPGTPTLHPIATRMDSWKDFDGCASRRVDVFFDGKCGFVPVKATAGTLQPESMLIVRLMQMIQRNEDVRSIEAALKHDAALTFRLLHHINSPAIGAGVEIHSLRHAVSMLGYAPLFRWLTLLLATSNKAISPFLTKKAIMRGRFVELMGLGMLPHSDADNLFVVGMFSLIDQLLGVTMEEVLGKVQLAESVQQAILTRGGVYGPFLALAEACETDGAAAARLSESLLMSAEQVNAAHLSALTWAQDVSPSEVGY
jgi:EAL and modified HD-GYP domain-containing signal transduction protein